MGHAEIVVRGLVEGILDGPDPQEEWAIPQAEVAEVAAVLITKIQAMPRHISLAMQVLIVVFDWYGCLRAGRRFHRQDRRERQRRIVEWGQAPFGVFRDFVEFYRRMGTFVLYARRESH